MAEFRSTADTVTVIFTTVDSFLPSPTERLQEAMQAGQVWGTDLPLGGPLGKGLEESPNQTPGVLLFVHASGQCVCGGRQRKDT